MKIPLLHQQIIIQTEKLREMHRSIMMLPAPLPISEIEILLREIRNLYSIVLELNNENAILLLDEVQLASNQLSADIIAKQENSKATNIPLVKTENGNQQEKTSISKKKEIEPEKKQPIGIHEFMKETTLADKFEDHQTIGEKIASNEMRKRLGDTLKSHVNDIKSIIGINEKFQFINILFKGDYSTYETAINSINASSTVEEAMKHLQSISSSDQWKSHPASARSFLDIIERRFSV